MTWNDRIVLNPDILLGKPAIKAAGSRWSHYRFLAQGWSRGYSRNYPGLAHEDIIACLSMPRPAARGTVFPCLR